MNINILVTPLDWGLGHASRCIPIINALKRRGLKVFIAGSGSSLSLLKTEFPDLPWFILPGYNPRYPKNSDMVWAMARQLPKFVFVIRREHIILEKIIAEYKIDYVISDNRYGCWSSKVPSILITHQSNILMPKRFGWLSKWVSKVNEKQFKKFTRCWLPDVPGSESLAGTLIHFGALPEGVCFDYIGHLSRFKPLQQELVYDVVAVCSGPEPQRSLLERLLLKQLTQADITFVLIRGVMDETVSLPLVPRGKIVNFLTGIQLEKILCQGKIIIARSGYSTVMDLGALRKRAIFIPTPGQTEQNYLAQRLKEKRIAFSMDQENFNLEEALTKSKDYTGFINTAQSHDLLNQAIDKTLRISSHHNNVLEI